MRRGRLERPVRGVHRGHRVLDGDPLRRGRRSGPARCGRAPAGSAPRGRCTTWERLSLVETCTVRSALRIASSVTSVSGAAETKLPPIPKNTLAFAVAQRLDRGRRVSKPCSRGGSKPNSSRSASRKCSAGSLPDAHRAVALHVGVAAHRAQPGAGLADVALEQGDVDDLLDRRDRVAVLGDAHRPADDGRAGVAEHPGRLLDLRPARGRSRGDGVPVEVASVRRPTRRSRWCAARRSRGRRSPTRAAATPIAWNSARSPLTRTGRCRSASAGAVADQAADLLRVLEPHQPGLAQRVDRDDLRAVPLGLLERA